MVKSDSGERSINMSISIRPGERDLIAEAAEDKGLNISRYIVESSLENIYRSKNPEHIKSKLKTSIEEWEAEKIVIDARIEDTKEQLKLIDLENAERQKKEEYKTAKEIELAEVRRKDKEYRGNDSERYDKAYKRCKDKYPGLSGMDFTEQTKLQTQEYESILRKYEINVGDAINFADSITV